MRVDESGGYRISIRLDEEFRSDSREPVELIETGSSLVDLTPADSARLWEACSELANGVADERVRQASETAHALTYLADPVGPQCIATILTGVDSRTDSILIGGLRKMGTEEAKRVLEIVAEGEGERAAMAKGALSWLRIVESGEPVPTLIE